MFIQNFELAKLRPADYNPRRISEDAMAQLRTSLRELGVVKAVIARDDNTIVAGHQRTRQMLEIGLTHAPAYVLEGVSDSDEIRFNQLHNAADVEVGGCEVRILNAPTTPGWHVVAWDQIQLLSGIRKAGALKEINRLRAKHGEWGNSVVGPDGRVLASALYAVSSSILREPLRVVVVDGERAATVREHLGRSYGEFSYGHLPPTTWAQSMAQMNRLAGEAQLTSTLYETLIIPRLTPGLRILDFGAGKMAYVKKLRAGGHDILGLEFYIRAGGGLAVGRVHSDIDVVCEALRTKGLFDMVICDSVINSVTSQAAEVAVLRTINALCRPGGTIAFSGRPRESIEDFDKHAASTGQARDVWFLDEDGITGIYKQGAWLHQKFHRIAQIRPIARRYVGSDVQHYVARSSFGAIGTKTVCISDAEAEAALREEFDLPLPDGSTFGRGDDIVAAWRVASKLGRRKPRKGS